nr:MAG TPA: hypothetical protein [Caudoviricetes sp.]
MNLLSVEHKTIRGSAHNSNYIITPSYWFVNNLVRSFYVTMLQLTS